MRQNKLLIVLYTCWLACLSLTSCTYDYFEDETNYIVFVPEVMNNTVSDCRVMVYNEAGMLVKVRYASSPFDKDPRIAKGQFAFRLPVGGTYKVYGYTNTDSLLFTDSSSLDQAAFRLSDNVSGKQRYNQPPDLFVEKLTPSIIRPGYLYVDTLQTQRYTGRITVRFRKLPAYASQIKSVRLSAQGIASKQHLKDDTWPTRLSENDVMYHQGELGSQPDPNMLEVDYRYFPSIQNGFTKLNLTFLDAAGNTLSSIPVEVVDPKTQVPLRLLSGQRIIIEIDSGFVVNISVVGWDENIRSGDTNLE
ncbi:MAG: hypothetical protein RR711_08370 [Bacteroides sp.]